MPLQIVKVLVVATSIVRQPLGVYRDEYMLIIDPTGLDDLDLRVLSNFSILPFKKEWIGNKDLETYFGSIFEGLKELARRLGYELVYDENPNEEEAKRASSQVYRRNTFGYTDMRMGSPKFRKS